jgi:hypothetical protein
VYSLPSTFFRLVNVWRDGGGILDTFDALQEPMLRDTTARILPEPLYQVRGSNIMLLPVPTSVMTIRLNYIPSLDDLSSGSTAFDGINGWEDYAVTFAARKILLKDGNDPQKLAMLTSDLQREVERIVRLAPRRDAFRPERVKDIKAARLHARARWWR